MVTCDGCLRALLVVTLVSNADAAWGRPRPMCSPDAMSLLDIGASGVRTDVNVDCNVDITSNTTLLHEAVRRKVGFGVVETLLGRGASPYAEDQAGATPLHWASMHCVADAAVSLCVRARRLGELRDTLRKVDVSGYTPLDSAEVGSCIPVAHLLAQFGAPRMRFHGGGDCTEQLVNAVLRSDSADLEWRLGTKKESSNCGLAGSAQRWRLLHLASAVVELTPAPRGEDVVATLLSHGAGVSYTDSRGQIPLHIAAKTGRGQLAAMLLEKAPSGVHHRDMRERTPLHLAARSGAMEVAKLLLAHGASRDSRDAAKLTPLDYAEREGHAYMVQLLTPPPDGGRFANFKLPPDGGLVEGNGEEPPNDNNVLLGAALGGTASFLVLCGMAAWARRRRGKVGIEHWDAEVDCSPVQEILVATKSGQESEGSVVKAHDSWDLEADRPVYESPSGRSKSRTKRESRGSMGPRMAALAEPQVYGASSLMEQSPESSSSQISTPVLKTKAPVFEAASTLVERAAASQRSGVPSSEWTLSLVNEIRPLVLRHKELAEALGHFGWSGRHFRTTPNLEKLAHALDSEAVRLRESRGIRSPTRSVSRIGSPVGAVGYRET